MRFVGAPRARRVAAVAVCAGVLLTGCGRSEFGYVSSSDHKAYFKVPFDWQFFDKRDILIASGQSLSGEANNQLSWLIGFDADPNPSVQHLVDIEALKYPVVTARVEQLPFSVRDQVSLRTLRNVVYPLDQLLDSNAAELLSARDIVLPGGFHGSQLVFDITLGGNTNVIGGNAVIRVNQTAVVDAGTRKMYVLLIKCESHCFRDNKSLIDQIAESWTVKEH